MVNVHEAHAQMVGMLDQHGLLSAGWKVRWNRMSGVAGITNYRTKTVTLSARAVERWDWPLVTELLRHELAHVMVGSGHAHGKVWELQVQALGGTPKEHCPRFSSGLARFIGRFGEGTNPMTVLLLVIASWIVVPPVGLAVTLFIIFGALVAGLRNARPVLTPDVIAQIERDVLS